MIECLTSGKHFKDTDALNECRKICANKECPWKIKSKIPWFPVTPIPKTESVETHTESKCPLCGSDLFVTATWVGENKVCCKNCDQIYTKQN